MGQRRQKRLNAVLRPSFLPNPLWLRFFLRSPTVWVRLPCVSKGLPQQRLRPPKRSLRGRSETSRPWPHCVSGRDVSELLLKTPWGHSGYESWLACPLAQPPKSGSPCRMLQRTRYDVFFLDFWRLKVRGKKCRCHKHLLALSSPGKCRIAIPLYFAG